MIPWYQNLPLWVTALPMLGAIVLLLVPKENRRTFELGALAITIVDFLLRHHHRHPCGWSLRMGNRAQHGIRLRNERGDRSQYGCR